MKAPKYVIERWEHGWVLASADYAQRSGIPMDALSECMKLFPKGAVMDCGIVHHLRHSGRPRTVVCIVTTASGDRWRAEIAEYLKFLPSQEKWWKGTDVGSSSAALFAVFCDAAWKHEADEAGHGGSVPKDADDFGRCERLIGLFPGWKARLGEVAAKYPETKWPAIVARWDEIVAAEWNRKHEILKTV